MEKLNPVEIRLQRLEDVLQRIDDTQTDILERLQALERKVRFQAVQLRAEGS